MNRSSRTPFFLMEIILSILLFSLTSAVCAQLFVRTHQKEQQARELQFAITEAETVSSLLRQSTASDAGELLAELSLAYSHSEHSTRGFLLSESTTPDEPALLAFFNDAFQPCSAENAAYRMTLFLKEAPLMTAELRFDSVENPQEQTQKEQLYRYSDEYLLQSFTISLYRPRPETCAEKEVP